MCGTANASFAVSGATRTDFTAPDDITRTRGEAGSPADPTALLGFIVMYADCSDTPPGAPDARYGRVFPMRADDVLFLGKAPAPAEVVGRDGRKVAPTQAHLFPFKDEFGHISRRHLVVQMEPGGKTGITDLSTNGLYLVKKAQHLRRGKGQDHTYHTVQGDETVVLGVDLGTASDKAAQEKSIGYRFQIVALPRGGA